MFLNMKPYLKRKKLNNNWNQIIYYVKDKILFNYKICIIRMVYVNLKEYINIILDKYLVILH